MTNLCTGFGISAGTVGPDRRRSRDGRRRAHGLYGRAGKGAAVSGEVHGGGEGE